MRFLFATSDVSSSDLFSIDPIDSHSGLSFGEQTSDVFSGAVFVSQVPTGLEEFSDAELANYGARFAPDVPSLSSIARGSYHTVGAGESLSAIAAAAGVSLQEILTHNSQLTDPNTIQVGDQIYIPFGSGGNILWYHIFLVFCV